MPFWAGSKCVFYIYIFYGTTYSIFLFYALSYFYHFHFLTVSLFHRVCLWKFFFCAIISAASATVVVSISVQYLFRQISKWANVFAVRPFFHPLLRTFLLYNSCSLILRLPPFFHSICCVKILVYVLHVSTRCTQVVFVSFNRFWRGHKVYEIDFVWIWNCRMIYTVTKGDNGWTVMGQRKQNDKFMEYWTSNDRISINIVRAKCKRRVSTTVV